MALCWTTRNDNNDDGVFSIETDYGYAAYGYSEDNAANDWLISPAFNLNGNQYAQFEYVCGLQVIQKNSKYMLSTTTEMLAFSFLR